MLVGSTAVGVLTFTDTSAGNVLLPNTVFTYRVAARDLNGNETSSTGQTVTTRSSYRQNVHPIWTARTCVTCHSFLVGTADQVLANSDFLNLTIAGANASSGRLPCHPAEDCDPPHTGGHLLDSSPNDNTVAGVDYRRILKWLQEGRGNN